MEEISDMSPSAPTLSLEVEEKPSRSMRVLRAIFSPEALSVLLAVGAFALWLYALPSINLNNISDLGLVTALTPLTISALAIIVVSYVIALQRPQLRAPLLLLHLVLLIFMLYGVTAVLEAVPRFSTVYRHAGFTEYIMRTGSVDPNLDAYFSWPGFFILSAFVTQSAGYHTILSYAAWAPFAFNILYLGPLFMTLSSLTRYKRIIWLGLLLFYLTNWIAQDYFSPQGFDFFFYLVIIAMLLKWFKTTAVPMYAAQTQAGAGSWRTRLAHMGDFLTRKQITAVEPATQGRSLNRAVRSILYWATAPDTLVTPAPARQRAALLTILLVMFAFVIYSHPLTPVFVCVSVLALAICGRIYPRWLPIVMVLMMLGWIYFMTRAFLAGHMYMVVGSFGHLFNIVSVNVTNRVSQGSPGHIVIANLRVAMTLTLWGMAVLGAFRRLRVGFHDISPMLLAVAIMPLIVTQDYGGEMLLRIYLFTQPFMVFFAASLFYVKVTRKVPYLTIAALALVCLVLLSGFLFTRYGNERMDYKTAAEFAGVQALYHAAPRGSALVALWSDTPWQYKDYEQYDIYVVGNQIPDAVANADVNAVLTYVRTRYHTHTYLIFTRSQNASAEVAAGISAATLNTLETGLVATGQFKLIYANADAQVYEYMRAS